MHLEGQVKRSSSSQKDDKRTVIALAVAFSGITATFLSGGRTAHPTLKMPINLTLFDSATCNINEGSDKADVLKRCEITV